MASSLQPAANTPEFSRISYPTDAIQDWRALRALSVYRWLVAGLICALLLSGYAPEVLSELRLPGFSWISFAYLLAALIFTVLLALQSPRLWLQIYLHIGFDLFFLTGLVYFSGGIAGGLSLLMFMPIAAAGALLSLRNGLLIAAIATLCLLNQEMILQLRTSIDAPRFAQAGIISGLLLISTLAAHRLTQRARLSELIAAQRQADLAQMARVNERIIQRMQLGVMVVDRAGHISQINQTARHLLDIPAGSTNISLDASAPELARAIESLSNPSQSQGRRKRHTLHIETANRTLLINTSLLGHRDSDQMLLFLEDAQRISEQAQQMKLASLGRLTASVAHEIRNPLSAINHASQLLSESEDLDPENSKLLDIVTRHSERIDQIVKDMLNLTRRQGTTPRIIPLKDWLLNAIEDYKESEKLKDFHISMLEIDDNLSISFDTNHLQQIVFNLFNNAVEHAQPESGSVEIVLSSGRWPDSDRIWLDISDNGRGIDEDVAEHIFDPFYTTNHQGTGLGLYIVRELCETNQARLSYIPTDKHGTTFRITFANSEEWLDVEQDSQSGLDKPNTQINLQ